MSAMRRVRIPRPGITLIVALGAAAALLTACSPSGSDAAPASVPAQGPKASAGPADTAPGWGHIHNLALDGDTLFLGTHEGLWQQDPQQEPVLLSQPPFDVMGLTRTGDRWLASGHPGPGMDGPGNLGLVASDDGGVTWQPVSLSGEVDFHRLTAAGDVVIGLPAHDGRLLRSEDGGQTWDDLGTAALYDLAVDPTAPEIVVATTAEGPVRSTDGGRTFTPITSPALLAFLAWTDSGLYAASVDGQILLSIDSGATWDVRGTLGGQPEALAADGSRVVAVVADAVVESTDAGFKFSPRLTGVGQH